MGYLMTFFGFFWDLVLICFEIFSLNFFDLKKMNYGVFEKEKVDFLKQNFWLFSKLLMLLLKVTDVTTENQK